MSNHKMKQERRSSKYQSVSVVLCTAYRVGGMPYVKEVCLRAGIPFRYHTIRSLLIKQGVWRGRQPTYVPVDTRYLGKVELTVEELEQLARTICQAIDMLDGIRKELAGLMAVGKAKYLLDRR